MRILRDSSRPKGNLTGTERRALGDLRKNTDLTILLADKGNATEVLNTTIARLEHSHRAQLTGGWPRAPQRQLNAKPHFCLRGLHLQRRFASEYIPWVQGC